MTIKGVFVGYGAEIHYIELAKILKIKLKHENKYENIKQICDYMDNDDSISISNTGYYIDCHPFPHDTKQDNDGILAVGIFVHIASFLDGNKKVVKRLENIISNGIIEEKFIKKYGKNIRLMIIPDDCQCCSGYPYD